MKPGLNLTWNLKPILHNQTIATFKKNITTQANVILQLQGKISRSVENLATFLRAEEKLQIQIGWISCYLENWRNEDLGNQKADKISKDFALFMHPLSVKLAFITNELITNIDKILLLINQKAEFKVYENYFSRIARLKTHRLSDTEETLLSQLGKCFGHGENFFAKLTNVDFRFQAIQTKKQKYELTSGNANYYLTHSQKEIRRQAYLNFWTEYAQHQNALAASYYSNLCETSTFAKIYKYSSSLSAALFGDNVSEFFYQKIYQEVKKQSFLITRWKTLLSTVTKIASPKPWDWTGTIFSKQDVQYSPIAAQKILQKSFACLGEDYLKKLHIMLTNQTIDWMPRPGKRSGAYSCGTWETIPQILLNWNGKYVDLSTLAHELGHAIHTLYSNEKQPFIYHSYPIFLAEVASITNELLLAEYLLTETQDIELQKMILEKMIREFIATVYRQAQFAEFESIVHARIDQEKPIVLDDIKKIASDLAPQYFPLLPKENYSDEFQNLWGLYIPHFYDDFYVYKYVVGMLSAATLVKRLKTGNKQAVQTYLQFLSSGNSFWPLDTLKQAGVDFTKQSTFDDAFTLFASWLDRLEILAIKKNKKSIL